MHLYVHLVKISWNPIIDLFRNSPLDLEKCHNFNVKTMSDKGQQIKWKIEVICDKEHWGYMMTWVLLEFWCTRLVSEWRSNAGCELEKIHSMCFTILTSHRICWAVKQSKHFILDSIVNPHIVCCSYCLSFAKSVQRKLFVFQLFILSIMCDLQDYQSLINLIQMQSFVLPQ